MSTLSEKIAHSTAYHHLSHLSVDIQLGGLIKFREDSGVSGLGTCQKLRFSQLLNMEPLELLRLQPSESIASESVRSGLLNASLCLISKLTHLLSVH